MKLTSVLCQFLTACALNVEAQLPKILSLHGGGGSAASMAFEASDLVNSLQGQYEFVFASIGSPNTAEVWWADPPSKDTPTTNPNHAVDMVRALETIRLREGPFYAILGFSQGAAAVPVYLSNVPPGTFQKAIMFCGYLPTTHIGLVNRIQQQRPFGQITALVWMGARDSIISNDMSNELASTFANPVVVVDPNLGHSVPRRGANTYASVINFIGGTDSSPFFSDSSPSNPTPYPFKPEKPNTESWSIDSYDKPNYDTNKPDKPNTWSSIGSFDKPDYNMENYYKPDKPNTESWEKPNYTTLYVSPTINPFKPEKPITESWFIDSYDKPNYNTNKPDKPNTWSWSIGSFHKPDYNIENYYKPSSIGSLNKPEYNIENYYKPNKPNTESWFYDKPNYITNNVSPYSKPWFANSNSNSNSKFNWNKGPVKSTWKNFG